MININNKSIEELELIVEGCTNLPQLKLITDIGQYKCILQHLFQHKNVISKLHEQNILKQYYYFQENPNATLEECLKCIFDCKNEKRE